MTHVAVSSWVKVTDGPDLATGVELDPETVAQATAALDEAGGATPERTIELLASSGSVSLLAVHVVASDGSAATVTVTPRNGADSGAALTVTGGLVVANVGVLAALVTGGPRALTLTNTGAAPVTVQVIAARSD